MKTTLPCHARRQGIKEMDPVPSNIHPYYGSHQDRNHFPPQNQKGALCQLLTACLLPCQSDQLETRCQGALDSMLSLGNMRMVTGPQDASRVGPSVFQCGSHVCFRNNIQADSF